MAQPIFMRALSLLLLLCLPATAFAELRILVSIKPIAFVVNEIAGDKVKVEQLIPDTASHHDYPLKMSDHKRLHQADLIIWIGPELESFLSRPLSNLPATKQLALMNLPNLDWPHTDTHDDHDHQQDPHLWLNPQNMAIVAQAISQQLILLDKSNQDIYQKNTQEFIARLSQLDGEIRQKMLPLRDKGFAVYHQAYSHYVDHYELKQLGFLTLTPERKSGAKHLAALYKTLAKDGQCIFAEPLMDKKKIEQLAKEHQLHLGYLDIMGIDANNYSQLMLTIADSFSACLSDRRR
jgi:zinc transport system substrate-binding protein